MGITVGFLPQGGGPRRAFLAIASNDARHTPYRVGLNGHGLHGDPSFQPVTSSEIGAISFDTMGRIMVSGHFSIGGVATWRLARFLPNGSEDTTFNVLPTGGGVRCIAALPDGRMIVGGSFTGVGGVVRNRLAILDETGAVDPDFNPNLNGTVECIAVQEDGRILVGGGFTSVGGIQRRYLARLHADGTLDSGFTLNAGSTVFTILSHPDGGIWLGGAFTTLSGTSSTRLARLHPDGTVDTGVHLPANGRVMSLALQSDGSVLVGGEFSSIKSVTRYCLARVGADGVIDPGFFPRMGTYASSDVVRTLAVQADGKILVGGSFSAVGESARAAIARLHSDGSLESVPFDPGADKRVTVFALHNDGALLVGGEFNVIGGIAQKRIARLPNDIPATRQLAVHHGSEIRWMIGGSAAELSRVRMERWDGAGWQDLGPASRIDGGWKLDQPSLPASGWVRATGCTSSGSTWPIQQVASYGPLLPDLVLTTDDGTELAVDGGMLDFDSTTWLEVGGSRELTLSNPGTAPLSGLALTISGDHAGDFNLDMPPPATLAPGQSALIRISFLPRGGGDRRASLDLQSNVALKTPLTVRLTGHAVHQDSDLTTVINGVVRTAVTQRDGSMLLAGEFTNVGGVARNRLARLLPDGSLDTTFTRNSTGTVNAVVVEADGRILVGGAFTWLGSSRNRIARIDPDGNLNAEFNPNANGEVHAITQQVDRKILVAGAFTTIGGQSRSGIARIASDGSIDAGFAPAVNGIVRTVAVEADGCILIGGSFTAVNGTARGGLARLHPDGTLDEDFLPEANGEIGALIVQRDGRIWIGSNFTNVNGLPRGRVARLMSDGTLDDGFSLAADGAVRSFALQADRAVLLTGDFQHLGNRRRDRIARLLPDGALDDAFDPSASATVHGVSILHDGRLLVYGAFTHLGGVSRERIALLPNNTPATEQWFATTGRIEWQLGGAAPEYGTVWFERWNGHEWTEMGGTVAVPGGWQIDEPLLPSSGWVRSLGTSRSGTGNGSAGIYERHDAFGTALPDLAITVDGSPAPGPGGPAVDFGSAAWLAPGEMHHFTITNTGSGMLEIHEVSSTSADFVVDAGGVSMIAPGEEAHFTCLFLPRGGGTRSASLSVSTNVATMPAFDIPVSGHGIHADPGFTAQSIRSVGAMAIDVNARIVANTSLAGGLSNNFSRADVFGMVDAAFDPGPSLYVLTIAMESDGGVLLGGSFDRFSSFGETRNRIARIDDSGMVDPDFNPNANGPVTIILPLPDGKMLVGGDFTSIGGVSRQRLALLENSGTADSAFLANANSTVRTIAPQPDGAILVGGAFSQIAGVPRNRCARLLPNGSLDPTFNPNVTPGTVRCIVVQTDGKIVIGGDFTSVGGIPRARIARLNSDGTLDTGYNPGANAAIHSMVLHADGDLTVGGAFTAIGGAQRNHIARLDAVGTVDPDFDPNSSHIVDALAVQADGRIFAGGLFSSLGGTARSRIARLPTHIESSLEWSVGEGGDVSWTPGGSAPAFTHVHFEFAADGAWESLGDASFVDGSWRLSVANLPDNTWLRATGRVASGMHNASSSLIRQVHAHGPLFPRLVVEDENGVALDLGRMPIQLGTVETGEMTNRQWSLRNAGTIALEVQEMHLGGASAITAHHTGSLILGPGESSALEIRYSPVTSGSHQTRLRIFSNDLTSEPWHALISGIAIEPPPLPGSFDAWTLLDTLPADRRGPLDRNGPLDLPNLLAFAMALDPLTANPDDMPQLVANDLIRGESVFRYRRAKNIVGTTLTPTLSNNLTDWSDAVILETSLIEDHPEWEIVEVRVAMSSTGRMFFRLAVE